MDRKIIAKTLFILLGMVSAGWAGCSAKAKCGEFKEKQDNPVDVVLNQLSRRTKQLKFYEAQVEYKIIQPVFESTTLRKGALYYAKSAEKSQLRADFAPGLPVKKFFAPSSLLLT